jgi:DUF4097 and DUF4098 domain-containing protein YvlB
MKAKKVYEFKQGQNPYDTMGVGANRIWPPEEWLPKAEAIIKKIFKDFPVDITREFKFMDVHWLDFDAYYITLGTSKLYWTPIDAYEGKVKFESGWHITSGGSGNSINGESSDFEELSRELQKIHDGYEVS